MLEETCTLFINMLLLLVATVAVCARKFLLYTVTVGDAYVPIARLSFNSLARQLNQTTAECELLVITTPTSQSAARRALEHYKLRHDVWAPYIKVPSVFMLRYVLEQWPRIREFDVALQFDNDMIVNRPLDRVLQLIANENLFYASTEKIADHTKILWSLDTYTRADLQQFERDNIRPMNCGLFAFFINDIMLGHISALRNWAAKEIAAGTKHFTDQSFVNVYMNTRGISETYGPFSEENVAMWADFNAVYPTQTFLHFIAGGITAQAAKVYAMQQYFKRMNWPTPPPISRGRPNQ